MQLGKKIEKKTWPALFSKIASGEKNFDIRLADFDCKPYDTLVFREWDPETQKYTGRIVEKQVSYVMKTKDLKFWTKEEIDKHGLQIIGLK